MKSNHTINKKEIRVFPFYKSLGTALCGKEKSQLTLPDAISKSIDCGVWTYINSNQAAAEGIHSDLKEHCCNVNLDQPTVCLTPATTLQQQKNAKALIDQWGERVAAAFAKSVSKFGSLKLSPESTAWEESEGLIRQMLLKKDVAVVPDQASGVIFVAGPVDVIGGVGQSLFEGISKIRKRVQREKLSVRKALELPPALFSILCHSDLKEQLSSVYPELEMSYRKDGQELIVTGLMEEIVEVQNCIFNRLLQLRYQKLEMDPFLLDFLKEVQEEKLTDMLFTTYGIKAAFKFSGNVPQLAAFTNETLRDAEDHLLNLLMSQYVGVEDSNVLKKPEWDQLLHHLENTNNKPCSRIRICTADQQVVVSGHRDVVINVSRELEDFLKQNAHVEETVVVKPDICLKFMKKHMKPHMEKLQDKVALSYRNEAICLNGSRGDVLNSKSLVEQLVSSVTFETFKVSVPGAKKLFDKLDNMDSLFAETGCLVQLLDKTVGEQGKTTTAPEPVYKLQTRDGTEIAVCKADLCSYPVHAVVIYANPDLKLTGGFQQALLNAAGPQLQEECDRLISLKGQLKPGDCVIMTASGQLCCRYIIHAVAPKFDGVDLMNMKRFAELKKAVQGSLELAKKKGCVSVALPTFSTPSGFVFGASVTAVIMKAVQEFFDEKQDHVALKRVHFVDTSDRNVTAMAATVKQHYARQSDSPSPKLPSTTTTSASPRNQTQSNPNCLGHVQTKEGLNITLVVGNIEDATVINDNILYLKSLYRHRFSFGNLKVSVFLTHFQTDVIVNSVFADLNLNRGAISSAILRAAGSQIQESINAKKKSGSIGEIIVTVAWRLKSMLVYHAVTPTTVQLTALKVVRCSLGFVLTVVCLTLK